MAIFVGWVALSVLAGMLASGKGRSGLGFCVLSLVLSPLVGLLAAAIVAKNDEADVAAGRAQRCPSCAETVKAAAVRCRFCGAALGDAGRRNIGGIVLD